MKRHETKRRNPREGIESLRVPSCWTAEQAILVLDFLEHLIDTIWCMHGGAIAKAIRAAHDRADRYDDGAAHAEGDIA